MNLGTARLCSSVDGIISLQINAIQAELARIDDRIAELGDSDEDRVEELLLRIARRMLLRDLEELYNLAQGDCEAPGSSRIHGAGLPAVVEA